MVAELGNFALILALCLAVIQSVLPLLGTYCDNGRLMRTGRFLATGQFVFLSLSLAVLIWAFVVSDFSVRYVASHSSLSQPTIYKVTAVWGGHEGSLLLWVWLLAAWGVAVAIFSRTLPREMLARVLAVLGMVSVGFLAFTVFTSNPFERIVPGPMDGRGMNPLLQDPGMILHPPLLYMGYVGTAVVFAFAMAALLGGRLDAAWARWSRPWTTVAWVFLTLGIAIGSWWAYYELGWGGWWFWDPVENASFLPWLTATALIHSLAVTEKRGGFKVWTLMLAILTFALTVLGAFIVRSGVITSVHAFATDPERGVFILGMLALTLLGSLTVYAWRAPKVGLGGSFAWYSRESLMMANNVLLAVACAAVFIGTLYPLALDAFGLGKISVGPPYFDTVFAPLMLPLLFLIGLGPAVMWKQANPSDTFRQLRWALLVSVIAGGLWPLTMGAWRPLTALSLMLATWIIVTALLDIHKRMGSARQPLATRLRKVMRPSFMGMHLAHVGLALIVVAIAMVNTYEVERDVRMEPGQTTSAAGFDFTLQRMEMVRGPNWDADQAVVDVTRDGRPVATLLPQRRYYDTQPQNPMHQASLHRAATRDVYVSLGERLVGDAWSFRLYYKPYMFWMWSGAILLSVGGLLAASDRRYRLARNRAVDTRHAGTQGSGPAREVTT
ncbi:MULTISPECIES: heme lyase CcmF/NrfE family subunit [Halomonas]|uniref:Cytochrome c-type biogenesis protein CcmF n=1 Tax=Halomonas chromatireducens TaxID=507626 RepID=A0A109ULL4_9GAMM|nr:MULTISPECIES: heme lyase CcmF/NrfE family subunit [Halomonas]AMD00728.1 Cytochrome c-type biogenesis protein CcmF [Halomonas chromatireducens]MBZ0330954.1 heme lyase CcmF/NrfE family subunit [Halomonas sp. ANAO-440]